MAPGDRLIGARLHRRQHQSRRGRPLAAAYQAKVVPGLLQTAAYMTGILTEVRQERGVEAGDIAEAVAERIGRQGYLLQRDRQFVFVIEEPVLRFRPYGTAVQRDQLKHLRSGFLSSPTRTRSAPTSPPGSTCSRSPCGASRPALSSRMR